MNELRVVGVPWHAGHQFELAKLFGSYDMILNHFREWGTVSRPIPANMKEIVELDKSKYDLAILHVDQQCVDPKINKGKLYREMKALTEGMKRVVINHMTPFDDNMDEDEVIAGMKELVGDIPMVVNSREAGKQWGWGTPIIHGLDVDEWFDLPKEPRAVCSLSTGGMNKAYRRELLHVTIEMLKEMGIDFIWVQADKKCNSFESYREYIGRSLVYFNPTWMSPMPRSRTEAMLSGCCIVSTKHQDWGDYIVNAEGKTYTQAMEGIPESERGVFEGINGFIVPDNPKSCAKLIEQLLTVRVADARRIGQKGKEMARAYFNHDRWAGDWEKFLQDNKII